VDKVSATTTQLENCILHHVYSGTVAASSCASK